MSDLYVGKSKLFFVLGLHRSGSSATAGVLHHLGANMGDDLLPPSLCNIRGFFENVHFVNLNDEILRTAGGSWDSPLNSKCIRDTKDSFDTEIRELISSQLKPVWGVKDPRFLLTFELWRPYFEAIADITYVFVHRPFASSVVSLANRDGLSVETAAQILGSYLYRFQTYKKTLENEKQDIIEVNYENLLDNPEPFVSEINRRMNNLPDHNLDSVKEFLCKELRTF